MTRTEILAEVERLGPKLVFGPHYVYSPANLEIAEKAIDLNASINQDWFQAIVCPLGALFLGKVSLGLPSTDVVDLDDVIVKLQPEFPEWEQLLIRFAFLGYPDQKYHSKFCDTSHSTGSFKCPAYKAAMLYSLKSFDYKFTAIIENIHQNGYFTV